MKSLFLKILLWFLAVMAVTVGGFVLTTASVMSATRGREHLFGRMLAFQTEEARHAYETGGREGLTAFLGRFQNVFQARGILTDSSGRDVLTGAERSDLIEAARQRRRAFRMRPAVLAHQSENGAYWFFLVVPGQRPGFSYFLPQYLWIVGVVVLLSYVLALHLTSPLRRLQKAVEQFGHGDFSARARSRRRDELGQLARTFDQMAGRMQTLLAAERRLLLDISHELRSPLARLAVAVELARSGEDRDAALNRIEKEADRLNALVGELLQVTRAEGDPTSLRDESVRLDELLRDVVDDCSVEAKARDCRIELKANPPAQVRGDRELLRRAIENVIRNAIRHAPRETPVEVSLSTDGYASIRIRDYGPGVPEEHLPRIFDAFYRVETDRNRSSGGVGLGLSIARRAVELHKGRIVARNSAPGLTVKIDIPAAG
jgi:two-component system sensor histidine kinase CpxA